MKGTSRFVVVAALGILALVVTSIVMAVLPSSPILAVQVDVDNIDERYHLELEQALHVQPYSGDVSVLDALKQSAGASGGVLATAEAAVGAFLRDAAANATTPANATATATAGRLPHIPPLIHQQWKSATVPNEHLDKVRAFISMHPSHTHLLWTDADLDDFVRKYHPAIVDLYRSLPKNVLRADLARYLLLLTFGGIYSDLDTSPLKPVGQWLPRSQARAARFIVGVEADVFQRGWKKYFTRSLQLCQWTMASAPDHPAVRRAVGLSLAITQQAMAAEQLKDEQTRARDRNGKDKSGIDVLETTGPGPWTDGILAELHLQNVPRRSLRKLEHSVLFGDVAVLPITAFSPGMHHMGSRPETDPEACVKHFFSGSWRLHSSWAAWFGMD
ncbi:nucleotide-diphospho-sugar transferase [Entophlyctis helioformis]|nr:nucleotide-diphospho-sugar transferase [Entophlyctis helioformis]